MSREDIINEFNIACQHYEPCDCLVDGADFMADEILKLRAAIDRVRALHGPTFDGTRCVACSMPDGDFELRPCPTLRALDGEDA
jgi:hypothetical protein